MVQSPPLHQARVPDPCATLIFGTTADLIGPTSMPVAGDRRQSRLIFGGSTLGVEAVNGWRDIRPPLLQDTRTA
jgi:hypothetical protein